VAAPFGAERIVMAWLLVLAGPLGWIGLFIIAAMRRPADQLRVTLPFSEGAYQRFIAARRRPTAWTVTVVATVLLALLGVAMQRPPTVVAGYALGALAVFALGQLVLAVRRANRSRVGVALDASRRWVTLTGVHPAFAAAARMQVQTARAQYEASAPR